jgi:hypothetical protein
VHRAAVSALEVLAHASFVAVVASMDGEEEQRLHLGLRHEVGGGDEALESIAPRFGAREARIDPGLVIPE